MECTLRGIFQTHFEAYAGRHRLPAYVHRAAYWIARCRTAQLGGHLRRCPEGHTEHAFYNSCHQRICPQCQGLATERWLERQRARLLNCVHHHLIFTIPHELNALWCWNRAPMAKLLFGTVRETLMELLGDSRHLGAQPAFLSALHTWGRSLSLHPHLHVLIADGGLDEHGAWLRPRRSHFLPARVLMLLFRGKLLAALRHAAEHRALRLPPDLTRERFASLRNRLGRKKWNVHIRARYAHGQGVAAYLARYLKGGPLKNSQLLSSAGERVRFRYRPHRDEDEGAGESVTLNLTPEAFLARYLTHLPQPGSQTMRGYGLYGQHSARHRLRTAFDRRAPGAQRLVSAVNRSYNAHSGVPRRARPTRRRTDTACTSRSRSRLRGVGQLNVRRAKKTHEDRPFHYRHFAHQSGASAPFVFVRVLRL